jgi:hypothetical protein
MIHPLIALVATRPELLSEHLGAYTQLATLEAADALAQLRARCLLWCSMVMGLLLGLIFGGGALMLLAVTPLSGMPMPALLLAVPLAPWLAAGLCAWILSHRPAPAHFPLLRQQMAFDGATLREAGKA